MGQGRQCCRTRRVLLWLRPPRSSRQVLGAWEVERASSMNVLDQQAVPDYECRSRLTVRHGVAS